MLLLTTIIDQFRYIKTQLKTIDFNTRLLGINPPNSLVIPMSLVLRSIILGWILIYRNWSISLTTKDGCRFPRKNFKWILKDDKSVEKSVKITTKYNFISYRLQHKAGFLFHLLFIHSVLLIIFRHLVFAILTKIVISTLISWMAGTLLKHSNSTTKDRKYTWLPNLYLHR